MFFVSPIGDHWEVRCRADPAHPDYADRAEALEAATRHARLLWERQQVATEVLLDGDDGGWIKVAAFGQMLSL